MAKNSSMTHADYWALWDNPVNRVGTHCQKYDARQAVFGRSDVMPLWVADMDLVAPPAVTQALMARAQHPIYGYTHYPDSLYHTLQQWFLQRYQWAIEREWIVMMPGVVPSIHAALAAFTQPKDTIIVQPPVYFPFMSAVKHTQRQCVHNVLVWSQQNYHIDFDLLDQQAATAKMLIFCSPHNPVGRVWTAAELHQLLEIAERHDLILLSDDIHADIIFSEHQHIFIGNLKNRFQDYIQRQVITALAPSKTFNIPGLGLSYLIIPNPHHRQALQTVIDQWQLINHNPFSITAFEAAYLQGEDWLNALLGYLDINRQQVVQTFNNAKLPIHLHKPQGTYLAWLDCREMGLKDAELKSFFLDQCGLGLSTGLQFGAPGSGFMRLNLACPHAQIQVALEAIQKGLRGRV